MTLSSIQNGFSAGEVSPSLYGRTDLAKYRQGAFTMRNMFANYRGGAASRAGTAYVGTCKQPGSSAPPRDIPFQFSLTQGYALEFGDFYMRIKANGAYVTETAQTLTGITNANPALFGCTSHGYSVGDWIFVSGAQGMTEFNGLTWIVHTVPTANTFTVTDLFGNVVSSLSYPAWTGGGTLARLYTLTMPYSGADLPYLKYTQSADTMTLTCVNSSTLTEYPSYELVRNGLTNWTLTADSFTSSILPPTSVGVTPTSSTTVSTFYSYVVTAVDATTGEESVASLPATCENNDISIYAGTNNVTWGAVVNASSYNIYQATPSYSVGVPVGSLYGFVGSVFGTSFVDTNITADFSTVPPTHQNPFARGAIIAMAVTGAGSGYTQSSAGITVNTSTGSGFIGVPVIIGGSLSAIYIENGGQNYRPGDTVVITGGTGATATLTTGPQSGTYPGTCAYYEQRRAYASSLNSPDTMWLSQPGAFNNMDSSTPVTDGDAIVATPWSQQVNGVQFMVPMPGGLVVLTGKGAWQVNGGNSASLTPSDITANPQAYNGCNDIVAPIVVNYDILYLQAKGSIFRDLSYNFFVNIYTGTDLTVLSNHLFTGHTFSQWCWAEEPYKLAWAVRDDGALLSLTYLKEQDVYAWARSDTLGQFVGVCSITEPPVDAVYTIVKRQVAGQTFYYSERMDNRIWQDPETAWCVDAGLNYSGTSPAAALVVSSATGAANITATNLVFGGSGYSAPVITALDPTGSGSGATFAVTLSSGVITGVTVINQGAGYDPSTTLTALDTTGSGAVIQPVVSNPVTVTASAGVFTSANVGSIIRSGGGKMTVTSYVSATQLTANITQPIAETVPNDPNNTPALAGPGTWSISAPVTSLSGLNHLNGMTVSILADGSVVPPQVVTNNSVTLPAPASKVLVGLPYAVQLQTSYLEPQGQPMTMQGRRKNIYSVSVRLEASRGIQVGTNQPDAASQPYNQTIAWSNMKEIKQRGASVLAGSDIPLFTGDIFVNVPADWDVRGQIAMQQTYPLPFNALSVVAFYNGGDSPG